MENNGYIKLYRKTLDNPIICKDSDHFAIWVYLLLKATHDSYDSIFGKERITLNSGQLITGRKQIAIDLHINESKVERVLKLLKSEHQIEQQTSSKNRLITILKWDNYQFSEQQNKQQVNNNRTTSEQQVNTYKNVKNVNNVKNDKDISTKATRFVPPTLSQVQEYSNESGYQIDADKFIDYYTSKGWLVGKSKMKDWKASVRNWNRNNKQYVQPKRVEVVTDYSQQQKSLSDKELQDLEKALKELK